MGKSIKLNVEGILDTKNTVNQVRQYLNRANEEVKSIIIRENKEYDDSELLRIIRNISEIEVDIESINNWIDETVEKLTNAETASIKTMENASYFACDTKSTKTTKRASKFANVGRSTATNPESGKKPNTTSLSQAEIDYREGRAPGYNPDATNNKTDKKTSNNTSSKTPQRALTDSQIDELYREGYATRSELDKAGDGELLSLWLEYQKDLRMANADKENLAVINKFFNDLTERIPEKSDTVNDYATFAFDVLKLSSKLSLNSLDDFTELLDNVLNPQVIGVEGGKEVEGKIGDINYVFYTSGEKNNNLVVYLPGSGEYGNKIDMLNGDYLRDNLMNISPNANVLILQTDSFNSFRNSSSKKEQFVDIVEQFLKDNECDNLILAGYSAGAHTMAYLANLIESGEGSLSGLKEALEGLIIVSGMEKKDYNSHDNLEDLPICIVTGTNDHEVSLKNTVNSFGYMFDRENLVSDIRSGELESPYTEGSNTIVWGDWGHESTPKMFSNEELWKWIYNITNQSGNTLSKEDLETLKEIKAYLLSSQQNEEESEQNENKSLQNKGQAESKPNKPKHQGEYKTENTDISQEENEETYNEIYQKVHDDVYKTAFMDAIDKSYVNDQQTSDAEFVELYKSEAQKAFEELDKSGLTEEEIKMYETAYEQVYGEAYEKAYNADFKK